jgi:hypothetical protein
MNCNIPPLHWPVDRAPIHTVPKLLEPRRLSSAPGTPFRVFTEGPGTQVLATLPWIFVPAVLVPIDLLVHFAIAAKLKSDPRATRVLAMANWEREWSPNPVDPI